jgi:hypothetical protein
MFVATQLIGFAAGGNQPSISFRASNTSGTDGTSFTFAGTDIGAAAANRHVIVGISGLTDGLADTTLDSCTVGGISATQQVEQKNGDGGHAWISIAKVTTGTTADIVFTTAATIARVGIIVWAAYDLLSATARATVGSSGTPAVLDANVLAGDIIVACAFTNAAATMTWTGLTERYDTTIEGAYVGGADHTAIISETPRVFRGTYTLVSRQAAALAVFR